jgi:hypothetical protein
MLRGVRRSPLALYNPPVEVERSPEFDPKRPVASAAAVLRAVLLAPKSFYLNFSAEGRLREPILFVLLVSAVSAVLRLLLVLIFSTEGAGEAGIAVLETIAYVALSPMLIGLFSGAYLLSVRTFVGPEGNFRQIYRMLAYAWAGAILFWIPGVGAFAFTYVTLVLMAIGIRYVYRTSFLTALVTALVGYVPAAIFYLLLILLGVFALDLSSSA